MSDHEKRVIDRPDIRALSYMGETERLKAQLVDEHQRAEQLGHQISDAGKPIGDQGEALVEAGGNAAAVLRSKFAQDDFEDVTGADVVISFTEPPRSKANRGGRHVEFGIALAMGKRVLVVGHRENIFHWLPQIEFFETPEQAMDAMQPAPAPFVMPTGMGI